MKNTFSLEQLTKTGNLDSKLISRRNTKDLMARFMEIKSVNPRLRQDQIAKELDCSSSTLQRYRNDLNMPPPYRTPPNSNKGRQEASIDHTHREHDLKRPCLTSFDLIKPGTNTKATVKHTSNEKNKNVPKAGSVHENVEYNDDVQMKFSIIITFKRN